MMSLDRLAAFAEQRVGGTLRRGKYTLESLVGIGSMAAVYRARHRNGTVVAIKMLHTEFVGDDLLHARFLRESYLVNQVLHPGIVRVLDDDVDDDGSTFLVLELLVGQTLEDDREAAGGRLAPLRALEVVRDLLDVLEAVHRADIVHRDLKPENVFVLTDGRIKLFDFGVARQGVSQITLAGQALGSPAYMAPEQAAGLLAEVDVRSDLYSVGAILFCLLTGHPVHEADTPQARLVLAATVPARSLFDLWPEAKGALANLVDVSLRFDKTLRWSSASEMARALDGVIGLIRPSGAAPRITPAPPSIPNTAVGWPAPWSPPRKA